MVPNGRRLHETHGRAVVCIPAAPARTHSLEASKAERRRHTQAADARALEAEHFQASVRAQDAHLRGRGGGGASTHKCAHEAISFVCCYREGSSRMAREQRGELSYGTRKWTLEVQ